MKVRRGSPSEVVAVVGESSAIRGSDYSREKARPTRATTPTKEPTTGREKARATRPDTTK